LYCGSAAKQVHVRRVSKPTERTPCGIVVSRREEVPGDAVLNEVGWPTFASGDRAEAGSHRLKERAPERFRAPAGVQECSALRSQGVELVRVPDDAYARRQVVR
jgi:hypothetical protein